tara:strand:+ start:817 stop:1185 length:369 start_codon:yes stop_codon:yes gene_type:complete
MTTTDLIMKSIENLILYGIEINISDEDSNEYLFQMEGYFNEKTDDLIATFDIDALLIQSIDGEEVCNIFIKDSIMRIIPSSSSHTFNVIVLMLEFITANNHLFEKKETEEHEEDSDDDFDWI